MDPDFPYSMSDLDGIDRHRAWERFFEGPRAGALISPVQESFGSSSSAAELMQ